MKLATTAPPKPNQQTRLVVDAMETIEARVGEQLQLLQTMGDKLGKLDDMFSRLDSLDQQFAAQAAQMHIV